jgi:hypothetical protein
MATKGGPTFDGSAFTGTGDSFPVSVSSLEATQTGLSATSPNQGATVSFEVTRYAVHGTLSIPAVNVSARIYWDAVDAGLTVLNYVSLGTWAEPQSNLGAYGSITAFAFGYETPKTSMPTTGTASYGGVAEGTVLKPVDGSIRAAFVRGAAGLSVDFASGKINGSFTGMTQSDYVSYANGSGHLAPVTGQIFGGGGSHPWNDVSVTATIAGGTNRFSGSTAATSSPTTTFSLSASAKGYIDGAFYGPDAENLGAIWSLSDGTGSALGTVGAQR